MGLVHAVGAGGADAGVVCPAVVVQEALVFLTDLLFQVESGFDEPVGGERLHLQRVTSRISAQFKTNGETTAFTGDHSSRDIFQ